MNEKNIDLIKKQNEIIIQKLEHVFGDSKKPNLSIETLNIMFRLLETNQKLIKNFELIINLNCLLRMMEYGIFSPKNKDSQCFIEMYFQSYLINHFKKMEQKEIILDHLIQYLDIQKLTKLEHCQLLFPFLIDYLNTFIEEEDMIFQNKAYYAIMQKFILSVFDSDFIDESQDSYNQIIYGSLKLAHYIVLARFTTLDRTVLFKKLINEFLFNKQCKRIKSDINFKILYEIIKKLLFYQPQLLTLLIDSIAPLLRKNEWRKNIYSAWSIEPQKQQKKIFCGLENLGATCYLNCLFQQLFMIRKFRDNFLGIDSRNYKPLYEQNQIYQLQNIFALLKYSKKRCISTKRFCDSFITYEGIPINPMVQSDSDQFFNTLMQKIESFLKFQNRHDVIENTFEGKLSNQLNCQGCPHNSQKNQNFLSIGLNIRNKKTLEQALEGFVEGEILDGDNAYFCQICQKKVKTVKRLCIKELPNILVIVLKRFEFNFDQMRKIKINNYLKFPQNLNMKKYTSNYLLGESKQEEGNFEYKLRGTVIHSGTSEGGHYYSFIKSNQKWYTFNDQLIQQTDVKKIEQDGFGGEDKDNESEFKFQKYKNAYILFYEKESFNDKIRVENQNEKVQESKSVINYEEQLKNQIILENNNADFLTIILDGHFARLFQNIAALQNPQSSKIVLLYFHSVVLRDKNRDEYIPNYYRIIIELLKKGDLAQWFLLQINHHYFKQFCIQAPKIIRYLCVSIIIESLKIVKQIPLNFINHAIYSIKKQGMTPFAKIFRYIGYKNKQSLINYEYVPRIIAILLEQTKSFSIINILPVDSYFGKEISEKQKQMEAVSTSLCQSLKQFDVDLEDLLKIFQKHHSREGSRAIAFNLSLKTTEQNIIGLISFFQANILNQNQYKKEDLEKYFFYIRYLCKLQAKEKSLWKIKKSIESLKRICFNARNYYDPMQLILRQITNIGLKNNIFVQQWRKSMLQKQSFDLIKTLKFWLKEIQRPLSLQKSDEYKRKTISLNFEDKYTYDQANKLLQQSCVKWMTDNEQIQIDQFESDIENQSWTKQLVIRDKRFKIKQHLGLIKKIEIDHQQKWGILEKTILENYLSL